MAKAYNLYKFVPRVPEKIIAKTKRPRRMAIIDQDICTGCLLCISFCPVDCIEPDKSPEFKAIPIPPVVIREAECIGCAACEKACKQLAWDSIIMMKIDDYEKDYNRMITDSLEASK